MARLISVVRNVLALVGLGALIAWAGYLWVGGTAGVAVAVRKGVCINSACGPCTPSPRFVRHAGECVK